ncbi:Fungal specific transcription factor domain [Ceratobasidium sp. AG-Ba]|nr:Fungal specific transcription factor domain [Ceratobasidium sp. AG-Ba]QRW07191.1 Fungal specific transcription factor domain [Ceratobasidium sp. AG-Ba]
MSKLYHRSKTGCLTCKTRRKKCDEKRPTCERCKAASLECLGYSYLANPVRKPRKPRSRTQTSRFEEAPVVTPVEPMLSQRVPDLPDERFIANVQTTAKSHGISLPVGSLQLKALMMTILVLDSDFGFSSQLQLAIDALGDHTLRDLYPSSLPQPVSTWNSIAPWLGVCGNNTRLLQGDQRDFCRVLGGQEIVSGPDICVSSDPRNHAPSAEPQGNSDPVDDEEDPEGVLELISPALALDRSVESNVLPYVLSTSLRWMMRSLFEPMTAAPMLVDFVTQYHKMPEETRYIVRLGATVLDQFDKDPELALGNCPEINQLHGILERKVALVKSRFSSQPEVYRVDALMALCHIHDMVMFRSLTSSMAFHIQILEQIAPLYQLFCNDSLQTLVQLQSQVPHSNPVFGQVLAMDILLSLSTCRPMILHYDATVCELGFNCNPIGLRWKDGLPNAFLVMLCQMNILRQDHAPNIESSVIDSFESRIANFEPSSERSPDSYLYLARMMVQECWRHFMYIYLYMGLCGANSHDIRVGKALKQFIKVLDKVQPGRMPDSFLAGMAAHREQDREIIRQRMRSVHESSQTGTYVNDAVYILETVWTTADAESRPAVWTDLRFACLVMTGIV